MSAARTRADDRARPILIAGPTASGKSELAMRLAEAFGGAVINADAIQVYRDLSILSARPTAADEARVPHRLYGHVDGADAYSAGRYANDVAEVLAALTEAGVRPIIVGGTGLYFKALLDGLSPIPEIGADVRTYWRETAARIGAGALHAMLAERDATMAARLRPTDTQRLTRALEVLDGTGRSLAYWQGLPGRPVLAGPTIRLVMRGDIEVLRGRCDARLDGMLARGVLEEIGRLAARRLAPGVPVMGAVGVAPFLAHLAGEVTLEAALETAKRQTRLYVKRQLTWLSRHMIAWKAVDLRLLERNSRSIIDFIESEGASG